MKPKSFFVGAVLNRTLRKHNLGKGFPCHGWLNMGLATCLLSCGKSNSFAFCLFLASVACWFCHPASGSEREPGVSGEAKPQELLASAVCQRRRLCYGDAALFYGSMQDKSRGRIAFHVAKQFGAMLSVGVWGNAEWFQLLVPGGFRGTASGGWSF